MCDVPCVTGFVAEDQVIFRVNLVYFIARKIFSGKVPGNSNELESWFMLLFR